MKVCIFTGPTLSAREATRVLEAHYLPPVAEGDVYRVALRRPQVIGIIDGYFERIPSVWHKEILWAMSQGIHVFGSASMGALRAAELEAFGMEGVGAIFEAYRDGRLEDDDEVAVVHASEEFEFRAASESMVNIRMTLNRAAEADVISPATRSALERIAKDLFYPHRCYPLLLERAAENGLCAQELAALKEWLPSGQVNQKREDALAMLRLIHQRLAQGVEPKTVQYCFEHTSMWECAWRFSGELRSYSSDEHETLLLDTVSDELRLEGDAYLVARQGAFLRCVATMEAQRLGMIMTERLLEEAHQSFCRKQGWNKPGHRDTWLQENGLNKEEFARLMEDEARIRWIEEQTGLAMMPYFVDQLRVTGVYARLATRAADKQSRLESSGLDNPSLAAAGVTEHQLLRWFFETRQGRPMVEDLSAHSAKFGFGSVDAFLRAVLREFLYLRELGVER